MLEKINDNFKSTKIAFKTLGCKLNFSETSEISRSLDDKIFKIVDFQSYADVYVINTCSVTENAEKKLKNLVSELLKLEKYFLKTLKFLKTQNCQILSDGNQFTLVLIRRVME